MDERMTSDARTDERTRDARGATDDADSGRLAALFVTPFGTLALLLAVVLAVSWQFIADPSRAVPAFDTAYYQWRAEVVQHADPAVLITLRGADGALAAGYRVAEGVLGALMRTVGGIGPETHTLVLSVMLRVLAGVGLAAYAWQRRRSALLAVLTILVVPALFLLQQFFGYLDNFLTLSLLAGVILLIEPMRRSWAAGIAAAAFMLIGGLSHPTTLVIFLVAIGAAILYHLIRERSIRATWSAWGPLIGAGTAAVAATVAFWIGGLWGPTSSFSDAAVPPPASVSYFLDRSLGVLRNFQPFDQGTTSPAIVWAGVGVLVAVMVIGLVDLLVRAFRDRDEFASVTVAWTLPLAGMFGFLIGSAYPYFRFFNSTLAPLLVVAVGLGALIAWGRRGGRALGVLTAVVVAALVGGWWWRGISAWNSSENIWLTPEVRTTTSAARAYLEAAPPDTRVLFVADAQPVEGQTQIPYDRYKKAHNALLAAMGGEIVADRLIGEGIYFGLVEDLEAGRPTTTGDEVYDALAADTADDVVGALRDQNDDAIVFLPLVFNAESPNAEIAAACGTDGAVACREIAGSGLVVLEDLTGPEVSDEQVAAAEAAAAEAAAFAASPPGPLSGIGTTLLAILRLALLFGVPGLLWLLAIRDRSWLEGLALVPMLSIGITTTVATVVLAVVRSPLTPALGWASWGISSVLGLALWLGSRRRAASR